MVSPAAAPMTSASLLLRAAPPGSGAGLPSASPAPLAPVDTYVESPSPGPSLARRALLVGLGVASLAGVLGAAAPAIAAEPPPPPDTSQVRVMPDREGPRKTFMEWLKERPRDAGPREGSQWDSASDNPFGEAPQGHRLEIHSVNDSFRDRTGALPDKDKRPGTQEGDDNGWTAELRIEHAYTEGQSQYVTTGRYQMVTQRGSWDPSPTYDGLRTDVLDLTHQVNQRRPLGDDGRTMLTWGVGGGVQFVGPMGGRQFQEAVHGVTGGRIGPDSGLQYNYSTNHVTVSPVVTGGAKVLRGLDQEGRFNAKGEVGASLVLGNGLGAAKAEVGVEAHPLERLRVDAGVGMYGTYTNGPALDFMRADGFRPGAYAEAAVRVTDHLHVFGRVDTGGVRDEAVYRIGISIPLGGGDRPWLDGPWK